MEETPEQPVKRGRGRPKKQPYIAVGDANAKELLATIDESRRQEILQEERRSSMAKQIAKYRLGVAEHYHRLQDGKTKLDLNSRPFQKAILADEATDIVILGSAQWGKASPLDAKVHTPDGWTTMGQIRVGDRVSVPDGGSAEVLGVYPQGKVPIYRVTFADGRSAEVCGEHLWETYVVPSRECPQRSLRPKCIKTPKIVTTNEIAKQLKELNSRHWQIRIPLAKPVEKPVADLPVPPYTLGLLLGDGSLSKGIIQYTTADPELAHAMTAEADGYEVVHSSGIGYYARGHKKGTRIKNVLMDRIRDLGLLGTNSYTKFIPTIYKEASVDQRLAILQGLMDSDGYASRSVSFASSSRMLAEDVQEIVRSLGGLASISVKIPTYWYKDEKRLGKPCYNVNIRIRNPKSLFRLKRKQDRATGKYQFDHSLMLRVESVEYVGEKEAQCIYIDHPRHLYITDNYVCTHNTEVLICHAVTCAGLCGLKVLWVISKADKRNKFVSDRINPCFGTVPQYKKMFEQAQARAAKSDSTGLKHFGDGAINFVYATADREFTSYAVDVGVIDEFQECDQQNLKKIDDRMAGSDWGFLMRVGHPDVPGTPENQNLSYLFDTSCQFVWKVPCPTCGRSVELNWHRHVVMEERNKLGGIVSVKPRDQEWRPDSPLDMRPVCDECARPMNRLSLKGFWEAQRPGAPRHGYRLGNIYNPSPTNRLSRLYERYLGCRHNVGDMKEFYNKVLGLEFAMGSERIDESMLTSCGNGSSGVVPYRFVPASVMQWKKVDENPEGTLVPA